MRKIHCGKMTDGGQKFRERAPGEQVAEVQHFQYERTLLNEGAGVVYRFGSDTLDLSRLSDNELRGRLAKELRTNPAISVFQEGATGTEIQITNEFIRNKVADRLDNQDQRWSEMVTGPMEITAVQTETVPAEREAARWVTVRSIESADGTYFSMRVNMNALTPEENDKLAGLQYAPPEEWQRFSYTLGNRAVDKEMHTGRG